MLRVLLSLTSNLGFKSIFTGQYNLLNIFAFFMVFFVVWLVFNSRKQINVYKRYYEEIFELLMALLSPLKSISFSSCIAGNSTHKQPYSVLTLIVLF